MAQVEIDINNYLSEEEKKEIAIDVFRQQVRSELFKSHNGTIQSDSEVQRIIGNITAQIVMSEVQKYIPDCEKMIKDKTIKALSENDYKYYVFKKKDVWDKDESLAITYMNETIKQCKDIVQQKIKDTIYQYDCSSDISKEISNEFGIMSDTFYKLSELFQNK